MKKMKEHRQINYNIHFAKITEIQETNILLNCRNRIDYNTIARMVVAISKKRCGYYAHPCQAEYEMRPKRPIYNKNEVRTPKVQNVTLEDESS